MFRIMKWAIRIVAVLLVIGSLSLTAGVLMFSSVAFLVSNAIEAVTGAKTVYSKLTTKVKVQEGKITTLSNDLTDKNKKLKVADTKIKKLTDLSLSGVNPVNYRGKIKPALSVIDDTTIRIFRRTAVRATRDVGSLAAQSIPYIGIAALVGATVWDLKDSCDTVKDIQELKKAFKLKLDDESKICSLEVPSTAEVLNKASVFSKETWDAGKEFIPDLPDLPDLPDISPILDKSKEWWNSIMGEPDN